MNLSWQLIWKIVLIFTLAGYSLLAIVVFCGGIGNIIDMLTELRMPLDPPEDKT